MLYRHHSTVHTDVVDCIENRLSF